MSGSWAAGWAVGDVLTATELTKSMGSVSDTTLVGTANPVDITGIPAGYANLLIAISTRSDAVATLAGLNFTFNNDTGSNYDTQTLGGNSTTASASSSYGTTAISVPGSPGSTAPANVFSSYLIFISDYANTSNHKAGYVTGAVKTGTAAASSFIDIRTVFWRSTAAISRITFNSAGNFVAGSRFTVYVLGP